MPRHLAPSLSSRATQPLVFSTGLQPCWAMVWTCRVRACARAFTHPPLRLRHDSPDAIDGTRGRSPAQRGVCTDLEAARTKVRVGGLIALNDYYRFEWEFLAQRGRWGAYGIVHATNEFLARYRGSFEVCRRLSGSDASRGAAHTRRFASPPPPALRLPVAYIQHSVRS